MLKKSSVPSERQMKKEKPGIAIGPQSDDIETKPVRKLKPRKRNKRNR